MIAALPLVSSTLSSLLGPSPAPTTPSATATSGDSFSSMMASLSQDTVDSLKTSESMSIAGIQGNATTQSVVDSVMKAQESLQTVLAVRDKAVAAFQDLARMAI